MDILITPTDQIGFNICRLKKRRSFVSLAKQGNKWVSPSIVVQAGTALVSEKNQISSRKMFLVGFTVTIKVGNSVKRNRIRRLLKSAVR